MILRYDQGMNTHPETPRPMPGRDPKTLTAEELLALPAYVLKRFEDLARANDQAEIKEVFEDFIAFAPDLARVATDLTARLDAERFAHANTAVKVKRMEELADRLEREADVEREKSNRTPHDYGWDDACTVAAHRIRTALNGETND